MICRQCRRSLTSRLTSSLSPSPTVASSISRRCISFVPQRQLQIQFHNNTRTQTQSIQSRFYSSEAASEALPKDDAAGANANAAAAAGPSSETAAAQKPKVVSSVVAGTVLRGLNYEKNKTDPVAKEDHEYPDWLWSLLEKSEAKAKAADVDVACMFLSIPCITYPTSYFLVFFFFSFNPLFLKRSLSLIESLFSLG